MRENKEILPARHGECSYQTYIADKREEIKEPKSYEKALLRKNRHNLKKVKQKRKKMEGNK